MEDNRQNVEGRSRMARSTGGNRPRRGTMPKGGDKEPERGTMRNPRGRPGKHREGEEERRTGGKARRGRPPALGEVVQSGESGEEVAGVGARAGAGELRLAGGARARGGGARAGGGGARAGEGGWVLANAGARSSHLADPTLREYPSHRPNPGTWCDF